MVTAAVAAPASSRWLEPMRSTLVIAPLALAASAAGLLLPDLYRDPVTIRPAMQGQDAVTLLVLPMLVASSMAAARGSTRARLIWIGLVGYLFYTYAGAAFGYQFNECFLLYVAIASLSAFALVASLTRLDVIAWHRSFDGREPRVAVAAFLIFIALMLAVLEIGQNVAFLVTGVTPLAVSNAGGLTFFPYVLDLGLVVPLAIVGAVWLARREPWGYVVASALLIKATTMGMALLAMNVFTWMAAGEPDGLSAFYGVLAGGGAILALWFLRHCHD